jgi:hypothetical protein
MAMGAEKVDHGTGWDVIFLIDSEAPVQAGQSKPAVFILRRDGDTD